MKINCLRTKGNYQVMLFGCFVQKSSISVEVAYFHNNIIENKIELYNPDIPSNIFKVIIPKNTLNLKKPAMLLNITIQST